MLTSELLGVPTCEAGYGDVRGPVDVLCQVATGMT